MELFRVILFIFLLIDISESTLQCVSEDCKRNRNDPEIKICRVEDLPEDSIIVDVKSLERNNRNKCFLNVNFGFRIDSIWVSGRCGGDFEVCFRRDPDDEMTTKTPPLTTSILPRRSTVHVVTIKSVETVKTTTLTGSGPKITPGNTTNVASANSTAVQDLKRRRELEGIAGILGGVVGGLIFMILFVTVLVVIVKRSPCYQNKYRKHFPENFPSHKRVSATISMETTMNDDTYDTLDMRREYHSYDTCKSTLSEPMHQYMTVFDSADGTISDFSGKSDRTRDLKDVKSVDEYTVSEPLTYATKRSETSSLMTHFGQYGILDPVETGFYKGFPISNNNKTRPVPPLPSSCDINILCEPCKTTQELNADKQMTKPVLNSDKVCTLNEGYELAKPLPGDEHEAEEKILAISSSVAPESTDKDSSVSNIEKTSVNGSLLPNQTSNNNSYSHIEDFTYSSAEQNVIHKEREDNYDHIEDISMS